MRRTKSMIISIILILLTFAGCTGVWFATPEEKAKQQSSQIIKCFENKDKDRLKSMFCKTVSDKCNLDEEIQKAFDAIDGKIISFDKPYGNTGGGEFEDGERIVQRSLGNIKNIKTQNNKTYSIYFNSYNINKTKPSLVGVTEIRIFDENTTLLAKIGCNEYIS